MIILAKYFYKNVSRRKLSDPATKYDFDSHALTYPEDLAEKTRWAEIWKMEEI